MTILGSYEDEDHRPDYGTVTVRDYWHRAREALTQHENPLLDESGTQWRQPGTIAVAGEGWLWASANDRRHAVRLEAHDSAPPEDTAEWAAVVETPFRCRAGRLRLDTLIPNSDETVHLTVPPGYHRVRLSRRPFGGSYRFRVQFWPAPPEPPRWRARSEPAVGKPYPSWQTVLGYGVQEVAWAVTGFGVPRSPGWLDGELTEHVDAYARQLKVSKPVTRRDAIPLLLAAGVLEQEGAGYRLAGSPPRAQDVLELPAEQVAIMNRQDRQHRYGGVAADIVAFTVWGGELPDLAEALLLDDVAEVLAAAGKIGVIRLREGRIVVAGKSPLSSRTSSSGRRHAGRRPRLR